MTFKLLVLRNTTCNHPLYIADTRNTLIDVQAKLVHAGRRDFRIQTMTEPQLVQVIDDLRSNRTCATCRPLPEGLNLT